MPRINSDDQIIDDEKETEGTGAVEDSFGRAGPLGGLFQLLISTPDVLGDGECISDELINVRRLYSQIVGQGRLKLRDLNERAFRRSENTQSA